MTFTERHRRALTLIADTFAPGDDAGIPSASAVGAPDLALHLAASGPRDADAAQLAKVLGLWVRCGRGTGGGRAGRCRPRCARARGGGVPRRPRLRRRRGARHRSAVHERGQLGGADLALRGAHARRRDRRELFDGVPHSRSGARGVGGAGRGPVRERRVRSRAGCGVVPARRHAGVLGAKQSTAKTWLRDAQAAGARIAVGVRARRVTTAAGQATGVEAVTAEGHPVTVRAKAVFVAAGSVQTPSLLLRSGLTNPNIGAHLRLHPATAVLGLMPEEVLPWTGTMQARYVDRFADLDGEGYGAILETAPITPALGSAFVNWRSGAQYLQRLAEWRNTVDVAVIVRDKGPGGRVRIGKDGEPIVDYTVAPADAEHMMQAMVGAARLVAAAGATRVRTTHQQETLWEPATGGIEAFEATIRRQGVGPGRLGLVALHIMGSARMGGSAATSAVDPDGRTWDVDGLYVADGSSFPTASGVNPMVSIQAISYMTAQRLAARLS